MPLCRNKQTGSSIVACSLFKHFSIRIEGKILYKRESEVAILAEVQHFVKFYSLDNEHCPLKKAALY